MENELNQSSLLEYDYDAQWNDDGHNALHVLLTGETDAYYADYAAQPTEQLVRCLSQGFVFQGHITRHGEPRGEPSEHLPSTAFVLFLQNHDQIGNRAFGERLHQLADPRAVQAATVLLLLSPMIPLMFMGDEFAAEQPFLFFTSHHGELAELVREGRRNEFAAFSAFTDPHKREQIPDPNAEQTFHASQPRLIGSGTAQQQETLALYRQLLQLRHQYIIPHLSGTQALGAHMLGYGAVSARWRLGNGSELRIDLNLSDTPVVNPPQTDAVWLFQQPPSRRSVGIGPTARVLRACQPHGRNPFATSGWRAPMSDAQLEILASRAGLAVDWIDANGRPQKVAPAVLRNVLIGLGHPASTAQEIDASLLELQASATRPPPAAAADQRCRRRRSIWRATSHRRRRVKSTLKTVHD